jgi:RNA polymerase sigma-70 factor, ECF subfamily
MAKPIGATPLSVSPRSAEAGIQPPVVSVSAEDFDQLVQQYWPKVYRYALANVRQTDYAASIAQDCFVRLHKSLPTFRYQCSLESWIMRIAVNQVRSHFRSRALRFWTKFVNVEKEPIQLESLAVDPTVGIESTIESGQQVNRIWQACQQLSARQREVFLLRFVEELEIREIANATGLEEGTVKAHLFRAVQKVRSIVNPSGKELG